MVNFMGVGVTQYVKDREIMSEQESLAKKYLKYSDAGWPNGDTWDDFFDYAKVSPGLRTDFTAAAILKQAQEMAVKCSPLK